jgi:ABC-2 type transport system ATP-binding protein
VVESALAAKRLVGYLPEGAPSYGEMTVHDFLEFIADIRGLSGEQRRRQLDDAIGRLSLQGVVQQSIETLSKGFKRRVGLAQAILHDPKVLVLDEPTDGLDPNQKHEVRALIQAMAKDKTIIVSTHILEEVHAVCNRAIIIARGKVLADDTPAALEARSRFHQAVSLSADNAQAARDVLVRIGDVAAVEIDTQDQRVTAFPRPGKAIFGAVVDAANGIKVRDCTRAGSSAKSSARSTTARKPHESDPSCSGANSRVTCDAGALRVHRHLPAASGAFTFYMGEYGAVRPTCSRFRLPPPAVPVPDSRSGDAVVGQAQVRQHRAAAHLAGDDGPGRARQVPRRLGLRRHRAGTDVSDLDHRELPR